jgi:soluble lytic murein transglycosylase-like protein
MPKTKRNSLAALGCAAAVALFGSTTAHSAERYTKLGALTTGAAVSAIALAEGAGAQAVDGARPDPEKKPSPRPQEPDVPVAQDGMIEGVPVSTLEAIAACESGGDPTAVNAAGYYGKYQFDLQTWAAVGGSGNPAEATEAEQDYRAALLYAQSGASPWPVCGQ